MITQRRVFQAKPGAAAAVVTKMKEFQPIFEKCGGPACGIYTDFFGGHTDRVVWEFDIESLAKLESLEEALQKDEYRKAYESWYEGLKPLIEGQRWNYGVERSRGLGEPTVVSQKSLVSEGWIRTNDLRTIYLKLAKLRLKGTSYAFSS